MKSLDDINAERTSTKIRDQQQEIESLRCELENERARDIHSCGPKCTRSGCVNRRLREELAASQAREQQWRELLSNCIVPFTNATMVKIAKWRVEEAFSIPSDTTALEAMIAKAGEVMRERCEVAWKDYVLGENIDDAINAIPCVTLEDLK